MSCIRFLKMTSFFYNSVSNLIPLHFCFTQPMLTPPGRITPVCIGTWSPTYKYVYFAAMVPCYADISFPLNQSYIQCFQEFTKTSQCSSFEQDYNEQWQRNLFGGMSPALCPTKINRLDPVGEDLRKSVPTDEIPQ